MSIITVGLGYGDEGKGATVDYLVRKHNSKLVVRYCGGFQAAHNVHLPNGQSHCFSQFGSGTLAGASTFLDKNVIVDPNSFQQEAKHLRSLGVSSPQSLVSVHPECLISTHYHIMANRLKENERGKSRHGSCGLGIGETRNLSLNHGISLKVKHLWDINKIKSRLSDIKDFYSNLNTDYSLDSIAEDLYNNRFTKVKDKIKFSPNIIFEGSQGVLLDQDFGEEPYNTWSNVTTDHAIEFCKDNNINYNIMGIIRWYCSRHGEGPFNEYKEDVKSIVDNDNTDHPWQGKMRFGPWDWDLLEKSGKRAKVNYLAVNHLDQGDEISSYRNLELKDINQKFNVRLLSFGNTYKDRKELL